MITFKIGDTIKSNRLAMRVGKIIEVHTNEFQEGYYIIEGGYAIRENQAVLVEAVA